MYFIYQYTLVNSSRANLLITQKMSVKLHDERMVKFLKEFGGEKARYTSEDQISLSLEENNISLEAGIDFLHGAGIIELVRNEKEENFPFISAYLITDSDNVEHLIEGMIDDGVFVKSKEKTSAYKNLSPEKNSLIVIYLENYSSSTIKNIYNEYSRVEGVAFLQAYYMKDEFKLDGYYSPSLGTPCHFCHVGRWRSREKRSFSMDQTSWNDVVDFLEAQEINVPPSIPLQATDKYFSLHVLRRKLQSLAGVPLTRVHLDEFCTSISVNLIRCEISSEPLPHWHSCGCLTGDW